ncbi:hypothetical protein BDK51DRAFT_41592 [Blyttiomyces helicus]|uniref:Uncharacterized protein n=1 Tax=Blyttiomyces helicus TaxID=388810 RepID=A0A4P9W5Q2_9FUNG|nr:hypothetical protein BDK51DRAFT_41592 [Blyttiomyces helicus]|eukprot:RKO87751.1 hypothetical protein BDK51DRAFT_41592 [Blyttiomyces helicus]
MPTRHSELLLSRSPRLASRVCGMQAGLAHERRGVEPHRSCHRCRASMEQDLSQVIRRREGEERLRRKLLGPRFCLVPSLAAVLDSSIPFSPPPQHQINVAAPAHLAIDMAKLVINTKQPAKAISAPEAGVTAGSVVTSQPSIPPQAPPMDKDTQKDITELKKTHHPHPVFTVGIVSIATCLSVLLVFFIAVIFKQDPSAIALTTMSIEMFVLLGVSAFADDLAAKLTDVSLRYRQHVNLDGLLLHVFPVLVKLVVNLLVVQGVATWTSR